jgi:hypothetical protein
MVTKVESLRCESRKVEVKGMYPQVQAVSCQSVFYSGDSGENGKDDGVRYT